MPDGGDQGDRRGRSGAHHDLLVEGHQVFETAAATRHNQEIGPRHRAAGLQPVEAFDRGGDLLRRALALDDHRPDEHTAREAIGQAMEDVANHRAGRRGDDADHLG